MSRKRTNKDTREFCSIKFFNENVISQLSSVFSDEPIKEEHDCCCDAIRKANHVEDLADDSIEPEDYVQDLKKLAQYTDSVFPPSMPKDAIKRSRARQKALKKADLIADGPKVCK